MPAEIRNEIGECDPPELMPQTYEECAAAGEELALEISDTTSEMADEGTGNEAPMCAVLDFDDGNGPGPVRWNANGMILSSFGGPWRSVCVTPSSGGSDNLPIILGGAGGGVVLLGALIAILVYFKCKASKTPAPASPQVQEAQVMPQVAAGKPWGSKFDPETGQAIPKFDPATGKQNWDA
jgi:hypothetical protein